MDFHEFNETLYTNNPDLIKKPNFGSAIGSLVDDVLVIKVGSDNFVEWYRFIGGSGDDDVDIGLIGADGNYYFTGTTWSLDGDISDWPPETESFSGDISDIMPKASDWYFIISPFGDLVYSTCTDTNFKIMQPSKCIQSTEKYYYVYNERYLPIGELDIIYNYNTKFNIMIAE